MMIGSSVSVESVLEKILSSVDNECLEREKNSTRVPKRKMKDTTIGTGKRRRVTLRESTDTQEINCRICYDPNKERPIMYPCKCKGTMGAVHLRCLEQWLEESNRNSCELCGHQFQVERTPRYRALQSLGVWLCLDQEHHQLYVRSLRTDLLRCVLFTPVTIVCSYGCAVASDFCAANNCDNFPPARWITYSLLAIMSLLIFTYFLWMYMIVQYHQKVWFYWWQKTSTVKIILSTGTTSQRSNSSQV